MSIISGLVMAFKTFFPVPTGESDPDLQECVVSPEGFPVTTTVSVLEYEDTYNETDRQEIDERDKVRIRTTKKLPDGTAIVREHDMYVKTVTQVYEDKAPELLKQIRRAAEGTYGNIDFSSSLRNRFFKS